jgi:Kef-type K+ transport system membrane component KefB
MPVDLMLFAAAETAHEGGSHLAFYLLGSALALWGIAVALLGMSRRRSFPSTARARNLVMLITTVLVVGACGSAAITG